MDMQAEINRINKKIHSLIAERKLYEEKIRQRNAIQYIKKHSLTLIDIQLSNVEGEQFQNAHDFSMWILETQHDNIRDYVEWSERIYTIDEFIEGKLTKADTGVFLTDLLRVYNDN